MKNLYYWLAICIGYCFGSVLYGYEIPRIFKKINICELSDDGNPGTYNAFRYGGFICGISVLIAELLKGFIPVFFSAKYIGRESVLFAFVMAAPVMGHAFSVYYFYMKFRMKYINREKNMPRVFADGNTGGKAIAVSFGVMLGLYPDTMPLTILSACYLFFSLILRIKSHARRTIITFGSVIALSLFFVKEKSVIFGIIIISFIVIYKHVICTEKEKVCES